jgi:photosystem II stability/assembly factor-like uncharacterized protein
VDAAYPAGSGTLSAVAIYHTTDSGANWTAIARVDEAHPTGQGLRLDLLTGGPSLVFTDGKHGFMNAASQDGVIGLYLSQDGGRTWQLDQLPKPGGWLPGLKGTELSLPIMFGTHGIVVLRSLTGSFTYTTTDGGLTWANPRPLPGNGFDVLSFVDASHWTDVETSLYRTADAGQTWHLVPSHLPAARFVSVSAASPQVLWAMVEEALATSRTLGVPESACVPTMLGPACYFLIRSTDGGTTWALAKVPAG